MLIRLEKPARLGQAVHPLAPLAAQSMLWGGELLFGMFSCRVHPGCTPAVYGRVEASKHADPLLSCVMSHLDMCFASVQETYRKCNSVAEFSNPHLSAISHYTCD